MRRITILGGRFDGLEVKRSHALDVRSRIGEHHNVVLCRQVRMLDHKLIVALDSDFRQTQSLKPGGKRGTKTVIASARIPVADDQDARATF